VSLEPLATQADVETELGRLLTTAEADRVAGLLAKASRLVRGYTRQTFTAATTTDVLRITGEQIRLTQRPVTAVTSVKLVGYDGVSRYVIPYSWDGLDIVTLFGGLQVINLPEALHDVPATTAEVTWAHGYAQVPDDIVGKVAEITARVFTSAVTTPGASYQSAGPFSVRVSAGYDGTVALTQDDKDQLVQAGYRRVLKVVGLMP
jgi:hypothetical protein